MVSTSERPGQVPPVYVLSVEVRQPEQATGKLRLLAYAIRRTESGTVPGREELHALLDAAMEEVEGDILILGSAAADRRSSGLIQQWYRISQRAARYLGSVEAGDRPESRQQNQRPREA